MAAPVALRRLAVAALVGGGLGITATGAPAQSLTSVRGLGYPILPVDARTEVLGGLGVGLQGLSSSLVNPAAPARVRRRGVVATVETSNRDIRLGDATGNTETTRFPLLRLFIPVRSAVVTAAYGAFLDQSWALTRPGTADVGSGPIPYNDFIESTGGIGQARLGVALPLGEDVSVGAAVGLYTGNQRVRFVRRFDTAAVAGFQPFDETSGWRYSGPMAAIGAEAELGNVSRVGVSLTWSGVVEADSIDGRAGARELQLPLQAAAGASAYLAPRLLAAVSARWSGWSSLEDPGGVAALLGGAGGPARDTWELGGGLELDDPESRDARTFPIRLGFQYRQLPFTFGGNAPDELFVGGGIGMRMGTDPENPLAMVDISVQRGTRTAAGGGAQPEDLEESVWRVALSLSLFGS